jgi:hypothetical protein
VSGSGRNDGFDCGEKTDQGATLARRKRIAGR